MSLTDRVSVIPKQIPAFAIVVYGISFYETIAYKSLMQSYFNTNLGDAATILIYDNTDSKNWDTGYGHLSNHENIRYYHDNLNPGISKAYNYLAKQAAICGKEWIVFLDQDTELTPNAVAGYIAAIQKKPQYLLKVPVLMADRKIFSPSRVVFKRTIMFAKLAPGEMKLSGHTVVNSGMLVNLDLFFAAKGYNESVKLDFADVLFINRLRNHIDDFEVLPLTFRHGFSHYTDDIEKSLGRYKIYKRDLANCPRNSLNDYFGYWLLGKLHLLKLIVKFKSLRFLKVGS